MDGCRWIPCISGRGGRRLLAVLMDTPSILHASQHYPLQAWRRRLSCWRLSSPSSGDWGWTLGMWGSRYPAAR